MHAGIRLVCDWQLAAGVLAPLWGELAVQLPDSGKPTPCTGIGQDHQVHYSPPLVLRERGWQFRLSGRRFAACVLGAEHRSADKSDLQGRLFMPAWHGAA